MGNDYATDAGDAWESDQNGNHIESFHSAGMGDRVASVNDPSSPKPIQVYFS